MCRLVVNGPNEIRDCLMVFNGMSQALRFVDLIVIAATSANAFDITGFFKVGDDVSNLPAR